MRKTYVRAARLLHDRDRDQHDGSLAAGASVDLLGGSDVEIAELCEAERER